MIWRGLAIGILISAPMGPVGILCIQRTLAKGRATGFHTGIGAAFSDLFYCLLTGFGLSFIESFIEHNQNIIQLIGSAVLIGFAYPFFRTGENIPAEKYSRRIPLHILQSLDSLSDNRIVRPFQFPYAGNKILPLYRGVHFDFRWSFALVVGGDLVCGQGSQPFQSSIHVAYQSHNRLRNPYIRNSGHSILHP